MATINGTAGNDIISYASNNGIINVTNGGDIINGGNGNDFIEVGLGNDTIIGGIGNDILSYLNATSAVTVNANITGAQNTGGSGTDTISEIEEIAGSIFDDTITGGGTVSVIYGAAGNDTLNSGIGLFRTYTYGGDGNDIINLGAATDRAYTLGGKGIDTINGSTGNDTIWGDEDGDTLNGNEGQDNLDGDDGNDTLNGGTGNDVINGDIGIDTAVFNITQASITEVRHFKSGGAYIISADGADSLVNIETLQFTDNTLTQTGTDVIRDLLLTRPIPTFSGATNAVTRYAGPVAWAEYENLGTSAGDIVTGSINNDFMNLLGGDDAANGGLGDDILDGGIGSNFLTGGGGNEIFFLDGRGGTNTWATITDFNAGDQINIFGWVLGTSKLLLTQASAGAVGYEGATFHYDLNNNGTIDTSITLTGLTVAQVPVINAFEGVLLIG